MVGEVGAHRSEENSGEATVSSGPDNEQVAMVVTEALSGVAVDGLAGDCDRLVMWEGLGAGEFVVGAAARCVGVIIRAGESGVDRRR